MAQLSKEYLDLISAFPLKPIRNKTELKCATKAMNALAFRGEDDLSGDEAAYLEVLSDLVGKYEDEHCPIRESTPAGMLAFYIEQKDVTQRAVAQETGIPISTISELLSGKRAFTRNHIERLAAYFHCNPAVFISSKALESKSA